MHWLIFLFSLLLIIVFHECGHFIAARFFQVSIDKFVIGFGKPLLRWKSTKHATEYILAPIVLGGYVQFSEKDVLHHVRFETLARWKKMLVLLAGPLANIFLALILMTIVFKMDFYEPIAIVGKVKEHAFLHQQGIGQGARVLQCNDASVLSWSDVIAHWHHQGNNILIFRYNGHEKTVHLIVPLSLTQEDLFQSLGFSPYIHPLPAIVGGFTQDSSAPAQGLKIGDELLEINRQEVHSLQDVSVILKSIPDELVQLKIKRQGQLIQLSLWLGHQREGHKRVGFIGIKAIPFSKLGSWYVKKHYSWLDATFQSFKWIRKILIWQFLSFRQGIEVSGPMGMARAAQDAWALSLKAYLLFLVWMNMGIGILNLLPIPILDGGQCMMLVIGKWIPAIEKEKYKKFLLRLSLLMLIALFLLGVINDCRG